MIIKTNKNKEIIDITDLVNEELAKTIAKKSICNLFLLHTTAALTTADLDPGTDLDMLDAFEAIVPAYAGPLRQGEDEASEARPNGRPKLKYRHPHNPEHAPDHIASALIGTSLTVPVEEGRLILGTWQRVVLIELDGPREREIVLSIYG